MKKLALIIAVAAFVTGCSSTKAPESVKNDQPIADQQLVSNFTRNSVKVEWSCKWFTGITDTTCVKAGIKAIEATGYAPAHGNSEALRETAFAVAHDVALDKLVRFIKQDLTSSRVTNTLTKNVEKAADQFEKTGKTTTVSEDDTATDASKSNRTNTNEVVRTVQDIIRTQATGIIRGAKITDEKIVDKQTVAVTVRWSTENADGVMGIGRYFGK